MNIQDRNPAGQLAVLHYGDGDYVVLKSGDHVVCAISGARIPIEALRYWNPETQEAFAGPAEALARWQALNPAA